MRPRALPGRGVDVQPLLFTFAARLVSQAGDTAATCFDKLALTTQQWITDSGGKCERGRADSHTEAVSASANHSNESGVDYTISVSLGRTRFGVEVAIGLRGPADAEVFCPPIINKLLEHATPFVGGQPVCDEVFRIDKLGVKDLEELLTDAARTLPVVVFSPNVEGQPLADPDDALNELYGLAHIAELTHRDATFALTSLVGNSWSCFNGAARIYWPGLNLDETPYRHPLFFPDKYAGDAGGESLIRELFRRVARAGVGRFAESPLLREAHAAVEKSQNADADARLAELSAGAAQAVELQAALAEAAEERGKLTEERDFARLQAEEAERRYAEEHGLWATVGQELSDARSRAAVHAARAARYRDRLVRGFKRARDAVDLASEEFPETLMFLPDAVQAAADSPYQHAAKLYTLFEALDEAARMRQSGGLGGELFEFFRAHGFEYKPHISNTTTGKFGNEYKFNYKGQKLLFSNHVTLGSGHDVRHCLSVHWHWDEADLRFVVGWCGKHLTNTMT